MKKLKHLSIITIVILLFAGCKKDKLTGDNNVLVGTWTSISTIFVCGVVAGQPSNPNLKLELKEKGNYKLCRGDKKIETGRILIFNGLVTFKCAEKDSELNDRKILKFNSDTLNIDLNACGDYDLIFIKN